MPDEEGRIEVPIEISTVESKEIRQLLERIERADSKLDKMERSGSIIRRGGLPQTGGGPSDIQTSPPTESVGRSSPSGFGLEEEGVSNATGELETGALAFTFGGTGERDSKTLPRGFKFKDISSLSPIERKNQFKELKTKVNEMEEMIKGPVGVGSILSIAGNPSGIINNLMNKLVPILAPILIAKGFIDLVIEKLFEPGGYFDRRYKRDISKEMVKLTNKDIKAKLRAGQAEVRVSSYTGIRVGKDLVSSNLEFNKRGKTIFSLAELESGY